MKNDEPVERENQAGTTVSRHFRKTSHPDEGSILGILPENAHLRISRKRLSDKMRDDKTLSRRFREREDALHIQE